MRAWDTSAVRDLSDFWVAISAAAPVIGLAQVVALATPAAARGPAWSRWLAALNIVAQAFALFAGLYSLSTGTSHWPTDAAITVAFFGLLIVAGTTLAFNA